MWKTGCRWLAILVLVMGAAGPRSFYLHGADGRGVISGVVQDQTGQAVDGASVQAENLDRGFTVTVVSQEQGRYTVSGLLPGQYEVRAWGGGFASDVNPRVDLKASQTAKADLSLGKQRDFVKTVSISQTAALMPDGEAKTIMVSICTDCHHYGLYTIISRRDDRDGWNRIIEVMKKNPYGYFRSLSITEEQQPVVVDYLAKHYGPGAPPLNPVKDIPKTWIRGAAAKGVITEYNLPSGAGAHDVAVDSHGIGWVSEGGHGVIGRLDPSTFVYSRFPLPGGKSSATAIAVDPQDRIWTFDGRNNRLVQYDPESSAFTSYPMPDKNRVGANTIRFHPNGTVWFTGIASNQIARVEPDTKKVTLFPVPSAVRLNIRVNPYGMAIDPDGMVWFAERRTDKVAKVEPRTGEIVEYDIPTRGAVLRRMSADADGNLWFGEFGGVGKLAKVDYRTAEITEYPTPTKHSGAYSVDVDRTRNIIWFNEMMANQIAQFDPRTGAFVEYPIPTPNSSVRRIEVDPSRPTRVWYSGLHVDTVGFLDVTE